MMNRREFVRNAGITIGGGLLHKEGLLDLAIGDRFLGKPNILLITTDQQSADALSCRIGTKFLHTPAMDSIASSGVTFTNAYCSNPLCVPSRTALFTGRYPHQTEVTSNDDQVKRLDGSFTCLGTVMKEAGYETGYVGKWHIPFSTKDPAAHGFDSTAGLKSNGVDKDLPSLADVFLKKDRVKPFFLVVSFVNPHNICEWARSEELKDGEIGVPPPTGECPPLVANHEPMKDEPEIMSVMRTSYQRSKLFPVGSFTEEKWRQYRWAYYRMIEQVDGRIGEVLKSLEASGQKENTVVIFTSDHGDQQGAHRWNQKTVLYEEAVRVPFIISGPRTIRGKVADELVNTGIDLLPTVCDMAAIPMPDKMPGESMKSIAESDRTRIRREFIVVENKMTQGEAVNGTKPTPAGRMIRSQRYKYTVFDSHSPSESLVDLQEDPGETVNLAHAAGQKAILDQHRTYLAQWSMETGDSFIPAR